MKKTSVVLLVILLMFSSISYASPSNWAISELEKASNYGLITESITGNYQQNITRQEFAELVVRLYSILSGKSIFIEKETSFKDTANLEVIKANKLGIVTGVGNGLFMPNNPITREEIAVMLYRTIKSIDKNLIDKKYESKFTDKNEISPWALEAVAFINNKGILKGSANKVSPKGMVTGEQSIALVLRTYEIFNNEIFNNSNIIDEQIKVEKDKDTITYPDGSKYTGKIQEGIPHGKGILLFPTGDKYEGDFYKGKVSGYGTLTLSNGNKYIGEFRNNQMHGKGNIYSMDGSVIEGIWENGKLIIKNDPPKVRVYSDSADSIQIGWDAVKGADYYYIYYSESSSGPWHYFNDELNNKRPMYWIDYYSSELYDLDSKSTIYFKMTSVKDGVESDYSNIVSATTLSIVENTEYKIVGPLHLYSDEKNSKFLGVLTSNKYYIDGIFNDYGTYGSKYSANSIWNTYGTYGSKYSSYSAFNDYSYSPPLIIDGNNNIVGRLTTNKFISGAINPYEIMGILIELGY